MVLIVTKTIFVVVDLMHIFLPFTKPKHRDGELYSYKMYYSLLFCLLLHICRRPTSISKILYIKLVMIPPSPNLKSQVFNNIKAQVIRTELFLLSFIL